MMAGRTVQALRVTAEALEKNDTLWRFFVATFLLSMFFIAWEAVKALSYVLTLGRL